MTLAEENVEALAQQLIAATEENEILEGRLTTLEAREKRVRGELEFIRDHGMSATKEVLVSVADRAIAILDGDAK